MKNPNRLHSATLKVLGSRFLEGKEILEGIVKNARRRYSLNGRIHLVISTNQGDLDVATEAGFEFDGRSGPKCIDWYVPNLGTIEERAAWFVHDCNGYALSLSFTDTNLLLYAMLRDLAHYRKPKATIIQLAVSLSKSWYGEPKKDDWCYQNIGKVHTEWTSK